MQRTDSSSPKDKAETPDAAPPDPNRPPEALVEFMMSGWKEPPRKPATKVPGLEHFRARRDALSERFPGEVLIIPTGHEKTRANDSPYRFRPGSDFYYLTGNTEPDCVLVLEPKPGRGHRHILYAEPEVDRSTPAFFTDRARGALWVGQRLGLEGTRVRFGVDEARPLAQVPDLLRALAKGSSPYRMLRGLSPQEALLPPRNAEESELAAALGTMRVVKSPYEIALIKRAVEASGRALEAAIRALRKATTEREIEAAYDAQARIEGAGVGFGTIVAAGPHATVMHWTRNDGKLKKGELVLIDAGVEINEIYTGDITRTFPVSGRFTREQRILYDLVIDALDAAVAAVKPGADFVAPHRAAMAVLARGLEKLGVLREPADEALREDRQTYKRYTLHNTSHMLGLDVHDCSAIPYRQGKLEPGMVLTIEPGLYFQADDLTVPARLRGIGIRVEDDVAVTRTGARVLSRSIPRKAREVEAWMARIWRGR